ncbi:Dyp-type peroxidase [Pseudomonas kilonensis]|uniref:Dyp-type peroxidase n=1 Tax=Pseudomonas kilonensis TaxID=132476 RepID=UPI00069DC341|nr:Dyp-type peroxidase [Pseudomonas kilonensis]
MKTASDIKLNLADIQGNILKAYRHPYAAYLFFQFPGATEGKKWLRHLLDVGVTSSEIWPEDFATGHRKKPSATLNCALTFAGLETLGVNGQRLALLPLAFKAGMYVRAGQLGDAREHWEPQLHDGAIHAMVMVYAESESARQSRVEALQQAAKTLGLSEVAGVIRADALAEQSEHFGFRDGIGQPSIEGGLVDEPGMGVPENDGRWRPLKPGEFLLGYTSEREAAPLPPSLLDLCLNGTYVVFRKLAQDVAAFRAFVRDAALSAFGSDGQVEQDQVAAKLVGRWRSGAPLVLSPSHDSGSAENNFRYRDDPEGLRCPLGAHIRRTNPRDALSDGTHVPFHRILRRGLPYGPPFETAPDADRGLVFLALNADIEAQFEFIQEQWVNKGEFAGLLTEERDPIIGANLDGQITVPGATHNPFVFGLNRFVSTRGGGYFLMPGITTLKRLADGTLQGDLHG